MPVGLKELVLDRLLEGLVVAIGDVLVDQFLESGINSFHVGHVRKWWGLREFGLAHGAPWPSRNLQ